MDLLNTSIQENLTRSEILFILYIENKQDTVLRPSDIFNELKLCPTTGNTAIKCLTAKNIIKVEYIDRYFRRFTLC